MIQNYALALLAQPFQLWNKLKYRSFLPAVSCIALALSSEEPVASEKGQDWFSKPVIATILSAILIVVTVPLTHYCLGKRKHSSFYFYHPFDGGVKYVVRQAVGWAIYSIAVLLCIVRLIQTKMNVPISVPMYLPALGNLIALLVVITSFFYFEHESLTSNNREDSRKRSARGLGITIAVLPLVIFTVLMLSAANQVSWFVAAGTLFLAFIYVRYRIYGAIHQFSLGWNNVGVLGLVLVSLSMICAACVELMVRYGKDCLELHLGEDGSFIIQIPTQAIALLATTFFLIAVPLTHGVAGKKMHQNYRSWQPFLGGSKFVFFQGLAWAIYSISAVLALHLFTSVIMNSSFSSESYLLPIQQAYANYAKPDSGLSAVLAPPPPAPAGVPLQGLLASMTAGGFFSQCLILVSLFFFDSSNEKQRTKLKFRICKWHKSLSHFLLTSVVYTVHWIWLGSCLGCVFLLPLQYSAAILVAFHAPYFLTFRGNPHLTGRRQWHKLQESEWVWNKMQRYFSGRIVQHSNKPLDPNQQYAFGFHPHGIYPVTIIWSTLCSDWKKVYAGPKITTLGATIMFYVPFMRDVVSWLGTMDVRRNNIQRLLTEGKNILLVPGGQADMLAHTSDPTTVVLSRKHKGFIQLAISHGIPLVPIFSFGENQVMDQISADKLAKWFVRRFRVNPSFPVGRWYLPIPRPVKVTVIVGDPIEVEKQENPSQEYLEEIYKKYFDHLQEMFERHKADAGYPNSRLLFTDSY